jgi:hypothetical protein
MLIHARDALFAKDVDQGVCHMRLRVMNTPVRTPGAKARCERVVGTMRRECLAFVIPLSERHLYDILKEWVTHYNESRPHMSLGPGLPMPRRTLLVPRQAYRHRMSTGQKVVARPVMGGFHHEDRLEQKAAWWARILNARDYRGNGLMRYTGSVKGEVIILQHPVSVPDGAEVDIFIPSVQEERRRGQEKRSVAKETFGMIRADPALVRAVLEEDVYET